MIQKPRGTQDYLGQEFNKRRDLESRFVDFYVNKGYQGLETPIFEQKNLFLRSVGEDTDIVSKELFDLEKKSDEIYSLRPEFTAGVIRALIEKGIKSMPLPVKVISLGPCFRYERPQKGRKRQFNQLNVESIGKESPEIDAQFISDAVNFLKEIGLGSVIVNINSLGSLETRVKYSEVLKNYLKSNSQELCELCVKRAERNPLRVLDCKNEQCKRAISEAPQISTVLSDEEKSNFKQVLEILKDKEIYYLEDAALVRGLDYYTGVIFEINVEGDESRLASIGGGGRYDKLVQELGGPEMPAIGLGLGFDRIIELLD